MRVIDKPYPLPIPVRRAITRLGQNLALARRRRHMSQAMLAERIGASVRTVQHMEQGSPTIAVQYIARALHVFGELEKLDVLLDASQDTVGLALANETLPKRVRMPSGKQNVGAL